MFPGAIAVMSVEFSPKRNVTFGPIVVLTAGGDLAWIIINGLARALGPVVVIKEARETKAEIMRRRMRLMGVCAVLGQALFGLSQIFVRRRRRARAAEVIREQRLDARPNQNVFVYRVASVNSEQCRALLRDLSPSVVAVYGTRILKAATLSAADAPFINYHAGINPKYRGQHPGYWALANGDSDNAGVTIHMVDTGVDTGAVLYQARVRFQPEDTITTYQYVQAASALPLFARAIADALDGRLTPRLVDLPSRQWFPPTLWQYLVNGFSRGVW